MAWLSDQIPQEIGEGIISLSRRGRNPSRGNDDPPRKKAK